MENSINQYIPLVKSIASNYINSGLPFDDLVQEGLLGVLEAKQKFKYEKGTEFSTYAYYWIKKKIIKALEKEKKENFYKNKLLEEISPILPETTDTDTIKLPATTSVEDKIIHFAFKEGKNLKEISEILNLPRERVRQLKQKALRKMKRLNSVRCPV